MDGTPWPSWQNQYLKETVIGSDSWFGLRNDGTVAVLGSSSSPNDTRILELQSWQNISELSMTGYSRYIPVGLCADGTVRVDFIQPETLKRWKAIYRAEKDRTTRRARAGWRSSRRRTTRRTSLAASRARAASRFSRRARSSFSGKRDRRGIPTSPARSRTPTSAVPRPHTEWQWAIFAPIYTLLTFPIFH